MDFIFAWGNFPKEDKSTKNAKISPTQKFPRLQKLVPSDIALKHKARVSF